MPLWLSIMQLLCEGHELFERHFLRADFGVQFHGGKGGVELVLGPAAFEVFTHHLAALAEGAFHHGGEGLVESVGVKRFGAPIKGEAGGVHARFGKETVRRNLEDLFHDITATDEQRKLAVIAWGMLGGEPLAIGTLTFEKGSEQENHFDTYYMPAPCAGEMVVSSIFLENVGIEAGPVRVYPGSHLIPPYRFSDGNVFVSGKEDEMPQAKAYITRKLSERGIEEKAITGNVGDTLIWHGQLYHGGTPIKDRSLTRKSLVTHYWDAKDVEPDQVATHRRGAHYLVRKHQTPTH